MFKVSVMPVNHTTRTKINIGERPVPLVASVNKRAKRLILKVDPVAGEILVTAPSKRAVPQAIDFARERIDWIAGQLDDALRAKPFVEGMRAPYRGQWRTLLRSGGPRAPVRLDDTFLPVIRVGGDAAHTNRRVMEWMKKQARLTLLERTDYYCHELGVRRKALRIGDTRTRWGSCASDGTLAFSWRLIMAPPAILDYVAAHECVHLLHLDHSPAFWRRLAALGVNARSAADWFDAHGAQLFAYGVEVKPR